MSNTDSARAPSYFSQVFERQILAQKQASDEGGPTPRVRTVYIDRDPETFCDIARHLQGYHVQPKDGAHFVRLFADAQFYSLPKLISQLFESEIYISIGNKPFRLNRDIFASPGNTPNYFTIGFAMFFTQPSQVFPGLNREGLLRPPSIMPPEVPNRSPQVFEEIIQLLRGYQVHIRNEDHRQQLLRDCKYFHLKGLEQKLIAHDISWNFERRKHEITIRLEDVKPSGISIISDDNTIPTNTTTPQPGWINYSRPYVDEQPRELILEISGESAKLDPKAGRIEFSGLTKQRMAALLGVISSKLGLPVSQEWPMGLKMVESLEKANGSLRQGINAGAATRNPGNTPISDERVKVSLGEDTFLMVDGVEVNVKEFAMVGEGDESGGDGMEERNKKRKRSDDGKKEAEWVVKKGQWRLKIQPVEGKKNGVGVVLMGVNVDAFASERARNKRRVFLK